LPVRDWKKDRSLERLGILGTSAAFLEAMGWADLAAPLRRLAQMSDAHLLDGLVSVWQVTPVD